MKGEYRIIGLMSGTSLDGLDLVDCSYYFESKWQYKVHQSITIPYPSALLERIQQAMSCSGLELMQLHHDIGLWVGKTIKKILTEPKETYDCIVSHGQTIFHQPNKGFTTQIGNGAVIYATTGIPTLCDLRSIDVALGGQGAPLVPIGDLLLFQDYPICLNLGGIANLSIQSGLNIKAYDICGCNLLLNPIANQLGLEYDRKGEIASKGLIDQNLFNELNSNPFFHLATPKSLGLEHIQAFEYKKINHSKISIENKLHTISHHIAYQISLHINDKTLITGGGAHNQFLIELIQAYSKHEIVLPNKETIDFKEAIIFGFLGALKRHNQDNCLSEVTGSQTNHIGGALYGNWDKYL